MGWSSKIKSWPTKYPIWGYAWFYCSCNRKLFMPGCPNTLEVDQSLCPKIVTVSCPDYYKWFDHLVTYLLGKVFLHGIFVKTLKQETPKFLSNRISVQKEEITAKCKCYFFQDLAIVSKDNFTKKNHLQSHYYLMERIWKEWKSGGL